MIELLLAAERAMSVGLVDQAERLFRQAADGDPRNSIAVVGLARVALERGDDAAALELARRALDIDPDNPAARRLVDRLVEVAAYRSGRAADVAPPPVAPSPWTPSTPAVPGPPASSRRRPGLLRRLLDRE